MRLKDRGTLEGVTNAPSKHRARVRAPELVGEGGWLNTGGKQLSLTDLRGKIVLLDFWTFCCINCLHVLDELRPLEEKYSDILVVIGVHSPKFAHETDHAAVQAAVERYEVRHAVLDDPALRTWQQYSVRAWPTLVVIDPEGYVVAEAAGEGHGEALDAVINELAAEHEQKGTLHRGEGPYSPPAQTATNLRFPGKVIALPDGTLCVSDSKHHQLVQLAADGVTELRRIGSGIRGHDDGSAEHARFAEPQGLLALPSEVATAVGYEIIIADTANHALRGISLTDGHVRTVARAPQRVPLSPWDLAWWQGVVVVAAAGVHQLWRFDPRIEDFTILAGTTSEGLRDGSLLESWFSQPSGLAVDGAKLWIADSESSALRYVEDDRVHTVIGQGSFDFGHVDGPAAQALLQHPLGVTVLPDHSIAISDTYNNAVRRYDPETGDVSTVATDVHEPSDAIVVNEELIVVESAAHRLTRLGDTGKASTELRQVLGEAKKTPRAVTDVRLGELTLTVMFSPAPGHKLDDRYGPATRLHIDVSPADLLIEGTGDGHELSRRLVTSAAEKSGVLHVTAQAASCDTEAEHPACYITRQDWGIPIRVEVDGVSELNLALRALPDSSDPTPG